MKLTVNGALRTLSIAKVDRERCIIAPMRALRCVFNEVDALTWKRHMVCRGDNVQYGDGDVPWPATIEIDANKKRNESDGFICAVRDRSAPNVFENVANWGNKKRADTRVCCRVRALVARRRASALYMRRRARKFSVRFS